MRSKAAANFDSQGINNCKKYFLTLSNSSISAKLNSVGVSLGCLEKDIIVSTKALRHMEFDRLKTTPIVSSRPDTTLIDDDEELNADSDSELLTHLIGEVCELGLDETMLGSIVNHKAKGRKSKSSSTKKISRASKRARQTKYTIVSQ
jgi:hypothetical protein